MDEVLKARVLVMVVFDEPHRPNIALRTDVLTVLKDPEWAASQAMQHARYSLDAVDARGYELSALSCEWIEPGCA